jgi:hypothetical protein
MFPEINRAWVLQIILSTLGYSADGAINPPPPPQAAPGAPPPDPAKLAEVQVKAQQEQREAATAIMETQAREKEQDMEDQNAQLDRESSERIEAMRLEEARLKSPVDKPANE